MHEESKPKIHITPRDNRFQARPNPLSKELEECKQDIKKLKKQIARLISSAEQEEKLLEEYQGKTIHLTLCTASHVGSHVKGTLQRITKFQIIIKKSGNDNEVCYYKSAIICYHIED